MSSQRQQGSISKSSKVEDNLKESTLQNIHIQCINNMRQKKNQMPFLKEKMLENISEQKQALISNLSKALIQLQDTVIEELRKRIKTIYQEEERDIQKYYQMSIDKITTQANLYENKISEILSILDEDSRESKKWQGKIASGIVEKEHNKVCESLLYFVIPHAEYEIKEESLLEIVDEIEQMLQRRHTMGTQVFMNNSVVRWKNKEVHEEEVFDKNNISMQVDANQLQQFSKIRHTKTGLDQYIEIKSQVRKSKLEQFGKMNRSDSSLTKLTKLTLEKKKLLQQLL